MFLNCDTISFVISYNCVFRTEVESASTKPDMKKQLKMLVNAIRRGEVPRKPLTGPAPEAPSPAISMPIVVERAPTTTTATPAPIPVTFSSLPDVAVDLYLPAVLPTGPMAPAPVSYVDSLYPGLPGLMGLGNKLTLPALEELGDDLLPRLEKESAYFLNYLAINMKLFFLS
jgi:hypothetical protein